MTAAPAFLAPLEVTFPLAAGDDITVRPASVGQLARLIGVVAPVVDSLMSIDDQALARVTAGEMQADDIAQLFELLGKHPERLLDMVAIATGLTPARVDDLLPDQFAFLFAVVVQVNADFFSRATPAFQAAGKVLQQASAAAAPKKAPLPGRAASTR